MEYIKKITNGLKELTESALAVLALAIVAQVLFGKDAAFFPVDVVGNVITITKSLGSEGLVGLAALGILISLFNRRK